MARSFDLMIAGVQKAGTTSLAHYLEQHPGLVGHSAREIPYFVRDALYERDFESVFRNYYPEEIEDDQLVLAKSAGVAYDEQAARRLYEHSPGCKILVVLRDPVERAYSAYWFLRRVGWETKSTFEAALEAEEERRDADGTKAMLCSYRARGIYHEQIARLWELFGNENVHVLLLRDLKTDPMATCQSIFRFVNVDPTFRPSIGERRNTAKEARSEWVSRWIASLSSSEHPLKRLVQRAVPTRWAKKVRRTLQRVNEADFSPPPMDEDTRQRLAAYFEPHNRTLETMIDRSLAHWTRVRNPSDSESTVTVSDGSA